MKIVVIGLGSMGKRRIRLLQKYNINFSIIGVDFREERRKEAEKLYGIKTYKELEKALENDKPDAAFISTSPLSHAQIIELCLESGLHIFTELNLVDRAYEQNMNLAKKKGKVLFLSSTFLYRKEIQYISECVKKQTETLAYQYHIGQYLPDWHPWEAYQDFFAGKKETNGCREIMAIEFPWLVEVFGDMKNIQAIRQKSTSLEIDFFDRYLLLIEHKKGHVGTVMVDVIARKAVRNFELTGENIYLRWDGSPTGLYLLDIEKKDEQNIYLYNEIDQLSEYSSLIIENAYYKEIVNFFGVIEGKEQPKYSFEKDKKILEWIAKLEENDTNENICINCD